LTGQLRSEVGEFERMTGAPLAAVNDRLKAAGAQPVTVRKKP
jgi:hypothetical protein